MHESPALRFPKFSSKPTHKIKKGQPLINYCFAPTKLQFPMETSPHLLNLVFISIFFFSVESGLAADVYTEALLALKSDDLLNSDTGLKDWSLSSGGNTTVDGIVACSWPGVSCDRNSTVVLGLDLSGKNLSGVLSGKQFLVFTKLVDLNLSYNSFSGELPGAIFNLTELKSLDISRNNFSGKFPGGVSGLKNLEVLDAFSNSFSGPLPVEVSELDYLKVLNLAGSYFNGPIPPEYGNFKSIQFIHLAGNYLSGNIPPELGKLQTVNHMEVGYNSYQGSIPWQQISNMSGIEYLDIADANLSGSIPSQVSNLTRLKSLFLFRNQLAGPIPPELSMIASLVDLDLSDNLISGSIPESFSKLRNLRLLSLMYNEMNGTVPESIAELPSLETLLIWNNYFSGTLPRGLGRNTKLKWVDVSTNNLVGPIPPDICSGGTLFKLILFSNGFNDSLLPSLSNCSSLVRLRLEENLFSGQIPLNFSLLLDLSYVDLSRNRFTGGIPSDIHRAPSLQYFNVSHNPGLRGVTPVSVWSSPALQNFSASSCNIMGEVPGFESCGPVSVIELSSNDLSGSLPGSVSDCKDLEWIDLSENRLSGNLPDEVAGLPDLEYLDLSHNNFTGPLPSKFVNANSLKLLNVSYNDFTGRIPSVKVFSSMGSSAFYGNTRLCGWPLRACPGSVAILGSKGTKKFLLVLLLCACAFVASMLVLGIVYVRIKGGARGQWKTVCFDGLPQFEADLISKSLSLAESNDICQVIVLPTGMAVLVKRINWDAKRMGELLLFVTGMGKARHENLVRLLGFCHNNDLAYLIYDHLPNGNLAEHIRAKTLKSDWTSNRRIINGIASGLGFLHQDSLIPHGDLKSSNVSFDENMQPKLTDFGLSQLTDFNALAKEQLSRDVYRFGEIILEVLSKGKLTSAGEFVQAKPKDMLLREIWDKNEVDGDESLQEDVKLVLEVALMCTKSSRCDRPLIGEALKLLLSRPNSSKN